MIWRLTTFAALLCAVMIGSAAGHGDTPLAAAWGVSAAIFAVAAIAAFLEDPDR